MHKYITALFVLFLFSCTSIKEPTNTLKKEEVKSVKKGRKLFGKITFYTPDLGESILGSEEGLAESSPDLFFKSGSDYYRVLISKEGVSKKEMDAQINKELKVRGEIIEAKGKDVFVGGVVVKDVLGHVIIYEITPLK